MVGIFSETRGAKRPATVVVDVERSGRIRGVHRPVRLAQADPVDERHALDPIEVAGERLLGVGGSPA